MKLNKRHLKEIRERVAEESVSTDDGKDQAIEGNVLPFDKRQ